MESTNALKTTEKLRETFVRFGLPRLVVSDNGPPFVSAYVQEFFKKNGIQHMTGPPFHPRSNGAAENSVKHFKTKIRAALSDPKNSRVSVNTLISRFLLTYRNTPHATTGRSPAEMMLGKTLRTRITMLSERAAPGV